MYPPPPPPPIKKESPQEKKIHPHTLKTLEHPDKKSLLTGNNLNPLRKP